MKNFFEHEAVNAKVIAERTTDKGKELDIQVKFQEADKINDNKRLYPKELLTREVNKINEKIRKGESVWSHSFHPPDGIGKPTDIAGQWKKVWMETDGACYGNLTILPTTAGKTMRVLAQAGRIGISSRGFGQTTEKEKMVNGKMTKYLEVNPDYKMASPGDFVVSPSVQGAFASVNEELNELGLLLDKAGDFSGVGMGFDMGKTPEDTLKVIYQSYITAGKFTGTFAQFRKWAGVGKVEKKDKEENKMKIKGLKLETIDKALEHSYRMDTERGVFKGSFEDWKTKNEQSILVVYADQLVAQGKFETVEKALMALGAKVKEEGKEEKRMKKVKPDDVLFEAKVLGISASAYAKKVNERIVETKAITEAEKELAPDQVLRLLKEARDAGFDISDKEVRARIIESAKATKDSKPEIPVLSEQEKKIASKATSRFLEDGVSGIHEKKIIGG